MFRITNLFFLLSISSFIFGMDSSDQKDNKQGGLNLKLLYNYDTPAIRLLNALKNSSSNSSANNTKLEKLVGEPIPTQSYQSRDNVPFVLTCFYKTSKSSK